MTLLNTSPLAAHLLAIADDELILAHRNSQWCGHAPVLEEDIAFANLALDELGHAALWYALHAQLAGADPHTAPDQLIYFREAFEFRAAQICALPNGDWAFSMLRQYLWDALEDTRLTALAASPFAPLAETAAKIRTEEIYHLRHTEAWVKRLGLGTEESQRRMQTALAELWPYTQQWFDPGTGADLGEWGVPDPEKLRAAWEARVIPLLGASGLAVPEVKPRTLSRALQSQYLIDILAELQQVARLDPAAKW